MNLVTAMGNSTDYTLATSVTPTGTGTISPANGIYSPGTVVTLTATSNSGYAFTGWGGDCSGTVNTCNVLMDNNKSVTAGFTATVTPLTNGVVVASLSDAVDNLKHFSIDVPSGMTSLTIKTYGGTGDVDLYTRRDSLPTTTDYDCRPYLVGNTETCTFTNPAAGLYYTTLYAYSAYSGVNLLASYVAESSTQTVLLIAASYSVSEEGGQIVIPVYRQGGTTGMVTVKYATANGTARSGSDYTSKKGTLSWNDGDSAGKSIVVPILNNTTKESSETFRVDLSGITGATLGTPKTATVTITDND
ncbi:MAG: Serine protease [uncultured bacterium]|nr:MAG: Serine protease [uncultured bacterium]